MNYGFDKKLIYDWMGSNEWLFKEINSFDGNPTYDSLMVFLSSIAEHTNFVYYFIALAVYAFLDFIIRKLTKKQGAGRLLVVWFGILCVFATSYAADGVTVKLLKEHFAYPRPYVALDAGEYTTLGSAKANDDYHSFPSGHASFITVLICSLWPIFSGRTGLFGAFLIFAVCWSRIAMGMHFPSDVLAGFLIAFIIVLAVRFFLYTLFAKVFRMKC